MTHVSDNIISNIDGDFWYYGHIHVDKFDDIDDEGNDKSVWYIFKTLLKSLEGQTATFWKGHCDYDDWDEEEEACW